MTDLEETAAQMADATKEKYSKPNVVRGVLTRFPRAMLAIARVSEFGTKKHEVPLDDVSYQDIPDAEVMYAEAEVRHLLMEAINGPFNLEDGLLHKAQKAWDALADLEVYLMQHDLEKGTVNE